MERERAVNDALATAPMTRVGVAHRPETIRAAGRVVVLDRGRVVEDRIQPAEEEHEHRRKITLHQAIVALTLLATLGAA